jgi:hypothetical protein
MYVYNPSYMGGINKIAASSWLLGYSTTWSVMQSSHGGCHPQPPFAAICGHESVQSGVTRLQSSHWKQNPANTVPDLCLSVHPNGPHIKRSLADKPKITSPHFVMQNVFSFLISYKAGGAKKNVQRFRAESLKMCVPLGCVTSGRKSPSLGDSRRELNDFICGISGPRTTYGIVAAMLPLIW